ncbi:Putative transposase of IS4/5 family [Streptomyces qinglanensis]|uniref:Putative transposase of IS4/5 family n=1 Tax=Streptomyces qinglanensis TaxID=943816 RepID=A0A1H9QRV7_9ACTN|nr:Putative transposase of IS4/5 family [Streptomyces qinglanensis]
MIDAIAYKFQTGTQWVHLPEKYGNWRGVCNRLRMWAVDGTWERVFTALVAQADAEEDPAWAVSVDGGWPAGGPETASGLLTATG